MNKFTNPLDNLKVASHCPADWNEMFGDARQRLCAECKLNVYNLSDMTQPEAESFLINAEGRVCVKFYRRADGTVLTQNCPVGWQAVKKRASLAAKAFVSICAGIFGGILAFNGFQPKQNVESENLIKVSGIDSNLPPNKVEDFEKVSVSPISDKKIEYYENVVGQLEIPSEKLPKEKTNSKKARR